MGGTTRSAVDAACHARSGSIPTLGREGIERRPTPRSRRRTVGPIVTGVTNITAGIGPEGGNRFGSTGAYPPCLATICWLAATSRAS
jgi:hypothetical protein